MCARRRVAAREQDASTHPVPALGAVIPRGSSVAALLMSAGGIRPRSVSAKPCSTRTLQHGRLSDHRAQCSGVKFICGERRNGASKERERIKERRRARATAARLPHWARRQRAEKRGPGQQRSASRRRAAACAVFFLRGRIYARCLWRRPRTGGPCPGVSVRGSPLCRGARPSARGCPQSAEQREERGQTISIPWSDEGANEKLLALAAVRKDSNRPLRVVAGRVAAFEFARTVSAMVVVARSPCAMSSATQAWDPAWTLQCSAVQPPIWVAGRRRARAAAQR